VRSPACSIAGVTASEGASGSGGFSDWDYKKPITITYSPTRYGGIFDGSTLTDYDILIELDTAALITAGKMKSDCDDLRVVESGGETKLDYWIEGGCNTSGP